MQKQTQGNIVVLFDKKVAATEKPFQEQQQDNNKTLEFHIQNQKRQAKTDKAILSQIARL